MKRITEFTGIPEHRILNLYAISEANFMANQCPGSPWGRPSRHIQPHGLILPFDKEEKEIFAINGDRSIITRAGVVDPSAQNYWGAIITDDEITLRGICSYWDRESLVILGEINRQKNS